MNLKYEITLNVDNDWKMNRHHFHDEFEILLSLSDAGHVFIEDKVYPLRKGSLLLIKDTILHRTIVDSSNTYERYVIHFSSETLERISSKKTSLHTIFSSLNMCIQLDDSEFSEILSIIKLIEPSKTKEFGNDILNHTYFIQMIVKISQLVRSKETYQEYTTADINKIEPVLAFLKENLHLKLSLDDIADNFFISKYHLCHQFKQYTGFTINEFIINSRIIQAKKYLREGLSVQEAGELSGFNNNSHFIRTFSKLAGISPGKYSREYKLM